MDCLKKVLIVDDDAEYVESSRAILEANAIGVAHASSIAEALILAETERPDAILLEAMMPEGTEGLHLIWTLRQHENPALREVPILLVSRIHQTLPFRLSPHDSDWEYAPGEFLPVCDILDKPVEPDVLLERARGMLGLT